MTVVVWDGKTLAADRQATRGNSRTMVKKIFRFDGVIYGFSGGCKEAALFKAWVEAGRVFENFKNYLDVKESDFTAIMIDTKKRCWIFQQSPIPYEVLSKTHVIGSGFEYATAALQFGKSAVDAVKFAVKNDIYCGMGVDSMEV